jgi:hypothetical protein
MLNLNDGKVHVYWTNHDYFSSESFDDLPKAYEYGKSKCFEFSLHHNGKVVASWGPIMGLHVMDPEAAVLFAARRS